MATLTNTQIQDILNQTYQQYTGQTDIESIDLSALVDSGSDEVTGLREKFTKALIGVVTKTWFTDTSYRGIYKDIFYEDYEKFGAITQMVSVEIPQAIQNSAWQDFVSGSSKVGQYTIYLPTVSTQYYTKTDSWALPITITGEQWDTAFRNESELNSFVNYIFMCVENAILQHLEDMNQSNRNNFIAQKINYASQSDAKGVHVVDLVEAYVTQTGRTEQDLTREQAMATPDFLRFASKEIEKYMDYFDHQTSLFNTAEKVRFTPYDRKVLQLNTDFVKAVEAYSLSTTFHDDLVKLPLYQDIAWWQAAGDLSFDDKTSIHVKIGETSGDEPQDITVEASGIVGLLCDKWAIIHTIRSNRVASQHFNIEDLTLYEYQHRDMYANNLTMNGVVFVMNDFKA